MAVLLSLGTFNGSFWFFHECFFIQNANGNGYYVFIYFNHVDCGRRSVSTIFNESKHDGGKLLPFNGVATLGHVSLGVFLRIE